MKFSLRDLFLVTTIVAILVAWWMDHGRQAAEIEHQWWLREAKTSSLFRVVRNPSASAPIPPQP